LSSCVLLWWEHQAFSTAAFNNIHNLVHPGSKRRSNSYPSDMSGHQWEWTVEIGLIGLTCVSTYKDHATCDCTYWNVRETIKKVWPRSPRYHLMPMSKGKRYCLTCVSRDGQRYFRWKIKKRRLWPEHSMKDEFANLEHLSKSPLIRDVSSNHISSVNWANWREQRTWERQANVMVERLYRQQWIVTQMANGYRYRSGIRAAWREDLQAIAAELVYGETLRLPGQFLVQRPTENSDGDINFVKELRRHFDELRPIDGTRHGKRRPFVFKDRSEGRPCIPSSRWTEEDAALRWPVRGHNTRWQKFYSRTRQKHNGLDRPN